MSINKYIYIISVLIGIICIYDSCINKNLKDFVIGIIILNLSYKIMYHPKD